MNEELATGKREQSIREQKLNDWSPYNCVNKSLINGALTAGKSEQSGWTKAH